MSMKGTGKYDDLCEAMVRATEADGVILIVLNGNRGSGFSASLTIDPATSGAPEKIPTVLREVATQIEQNIEEVKKSWT